VDGFLSTVLAAAAASIKVETENHESVKQSNSIMPNNFNYSK